MDNNFNIDLCVMDSITIVRALQRERLAIRENLRTFITDDENKYLQEKRFVRVNILLDKFEKSMKEISPEEVKSNYLDDSLGI